MTTIDDLLDHHAIARLTHDYCWALDTGDFETNFSDAFIEAKG